MLETKNKKLTYFLLGLQPILACIRIIPARFWTKEQNYTQVFYDENALKRLQEMTSDSSLCIVGPDDSKCINFYFLRKKGFGYSESISKIELENYIKRGAKYIYTTQSELIMDPEKAELFNEKIGQEGDFLVYSLSKKVVEH
jgi:hypothetical protein